MNNLLLYYILQFAGNTGKNVSKIWFIFFTSLSIVHKYRLKQQNISKTRELENKDAVIKGLEEENRMKSKQIEDLENLDIDRGSIIDKIDNHTLSESEELSKLIARRRELVNQYESDIKPRRDELLNQSYNLEKSLQNNEDISPEVIEEFSSNVNSVGKQASDNLIETKSITEQIMEWANSRKGGNSLIDWSDQIINTFDTDTIINYGGLLLIIWGLLSIILMYSGSYVIDRFQLRGRNYYLDKFIDYRLKLLPYLIKFEVGSIVLILLLITTYNAI